MNKKEIYELLKNYPKEIFHHLTKDNFKLAKEFWGEDQLTITYDDDKSHKEFGGILSYNYDESGCMKWEGKEYLYYLQKTAISKEQLKYIKRFL